MALVNSNHILYDARQGHYAIGAFNIENLEMAQAVIEAAEELKSPVIIATSTSTLHYAPIDTYFAMIQSLANKSKVPVALHLDHGDSFELCIEAIRTGYTSVMIDGSELSYNDNIQLSKNVSDIGKLFNVSVEAELGAIAGKGKTMVILTHPETAKDFAERTGVDALAVAIGTSHGVYKQTPNLDYERLQQIQGLVNIPLVLHGASGLNNEQIQKCVKFGVQKINIATELRIAYVNTLKEFMESNPGVIDPRKYGKAAKEAMKQVVKHKIQLLGSKNRYGTI